MAWGIVLQVMALQDHLASSFLPQYSYLTRIGTPHWYGTCATLGQPLICLPEQSPQIDKK